MLMQPRPSAEARNPPRPSVRRCIVGLLWGAVTPTRSVGDRSSQVNRVFSLQVTLNAIQRVDGYGPSDPPPAVDRRHEGDLDPVDRLLSRLQLPRRLALSEASVRWVPGGDASLVCPGDAARRARLRAGVLRGRIRSARLSRRRSVSRAERLRADVLPRQDGRAAERVGRLVPHPAVAVVPDVLART